jgi:transcription antitermination factor NusG
MIGFLDLPSASVALPLESTAQRRWWVIHTRPRCEKKIDQWFAQQGWDHYLPTRPKKRTYQSKVVTFQNPLFPGYTFGVFSLLERHSVYGSEYAASVLEAVDQERLIHELDQLRLALSHDQDLKECAYLKIGQRARVTLGKLRGLEGILQRRQGQSRMILSVEMLQRSVSVEVDPEWLEVVA